MLKLIQLTNKGDTTMKIKVTRKDGSPIIGRKKSLTFTISNDLEQLSKASGTLKNSPLPIANVTSKPTSQPSRVVQ